MRAAFGQTRTVSIAACLWLTAAAAQAQRQTYRQYGPQQGLTNLAVYCLLQDRQGFLWAGTDNGLFRYDGTAFRGYFRHDGLPASFVRSLAESPDGELWAGTDQGYAKLADDRFVPVRIGGAAPPNPALLSFDGKGQVFVTQAEGLFRRNLAPGGEFERIASGKVTALYANGKGVWFAQGPAVFEWDEGAKAARPVAPGLPDTQPWTAILKDRLGGLWVRSASLLFHLPKGAQRFVDRSAGVPICSAKTCHLATDGERILISTDRGLYRIAAGTGALDGPLDAAHGLPFESVRASLVTRDGSLWIGFFGGGLVRQLGRGHWTSWQREDGLPSNTTWAISPQANGRVWVGGNEGLSWIDRQSGRVIRTWTKRDGLTVQRIEGLAPVGVDSVFAATRPAGVAFIDPKTGAVRSYGTEAGFSVSAATTGIVRDRQNRLWTITGDRCMRASAANPLQLRFEAVSLQGLPNGAHLSGTIAQDSQGYLLIGTSAGLLRLHENGNEAHLWTSTAGLRADSVAAAVEGAPGVYWVRYADSRGLTRLQLGSDRPIVRHYERGKGLGSDAVFGVAADRKGNVWVTTDNGIDVLDTNGHWRHYGPEDGLIGADCDEGAIAVSPDADEIWIGASNGLSRFSPQHGRGEEESPRAVLTSIETASQRLRAGVSPLLPYSQRSLLLQFSTLDFSREASARFRYRLTGGGDEDSDWIETSQRSIRYSGLPAGSFRFEVQAIEDGVAGPPDAFEFAIERPFWQTWWFRLCWLSGAALLARAVWRVRMRVLLSQKAELEKQVAERTAQLQESNRKLEEIAYLDSLTQLPNRRMFSQEFERRIAHATRYSERFALVLLDLDRFKPVNDTYGHDAGDALLIETGKRIRSVLREDDSVARLGGDEFGILLTRIEEPETADVICRRLNEAVTEPVGFRGDMLQIGLSAGIAIFPTSGQTQETLYKAADTALYNSKRSRRPIQQPL